MTKNKELWVRLVVSCIGPTKEYNAVIAPKGGVDGPYWTLIGGGDDAEQWRIAKYIVRAVNAYAKRQKP